MLTTLTDSQTDGQTAVLTTGDKKSSLELEAFVTIRSFLPRNNLVSRAVEILLEPFAWS